jgi:hypothetical protein
MASTQFIIRSLGRANERLLSFFEEHCPKEDADGKLLPRGGPSRISIRRCQRRALALTLARALALTLARALALTLARGSRSHSRSCSRSHWLSLVLSLSLSLVLSVTLVVCTLCSFLRSVALTLARALGHSRAVHSCSFLRSVALSCVLSLFHALSPYLVPAVSLVPCRCSSLSCSVAVSLSCSVAVSLSCSVAVSLSRALSLSLSLLLSISRCRECRSLSLAVALALL